MVFGSFKATLNFSGRKKKKDHDTIASIGSFNGAYRTNRDEFFGYSSIDDQRQTIPVVMPSELQPRPERPLRATKSTSDLIRDKNLPQNLLQSNPAISQDPRGQSQIDIRETQATSKPNKQNAPVKLQAEIKLEKQRLAQVKKEEKQRIAQLRKEERERLDQQKKAEKERLDQQRKQLRLAQQEQAKQEKLRKEMERKELNEMKKNKKGPAPKPLSNPLAVASTSQPQPQPISRTKNQTPSQEQPILRNKNQGNASRGGQYSTNTLESSISRSSGPPPYEEQRRSENDKSNITFSKPVDTGSWDLISQHREQLNRAIIKEGQKRQTTLDLNYKMGDNSDA